MSDEENVVHLHHETSRRLLNIERELWGLANAFRITGNEKVHDQLNGIAEEIGDARVSSHRVFDAMQNESLRIVRQGTVNMLGAALAMSGVRMDEVLKEDEG